MHFEKQYHNPFKINSFKERCCLLEKNYNAKFLITCNSFPDSKFLAFTLKKKKGFHKDVTGASP